MYQHDRNNLFDFSNLMGTFEQTSDKQTLTDDLERFRDYIQKPHYERALESINRLIVTLPHLTTCQVLDRLGEIVWEIYTAPPRRVNIEGLITAGWVAIQERLFPEHEYIKKRGRIEVRPRE